MILSTLLLVLTLSAPTPPRVAADTAKAPKPPPLQPTLKGKAPPKGKPLGEPQLKRRKPPELGFRIH